ncbi:MAG: di-heme enzyme [Spirochaetia bacterium]|nr:di-heme enzyme [Spirochaetia bacterium]
MKPLFNRSKLLVILFGFCLAFACKKKDSDESSLLLLALALRSNSGCPTYAWNLPSSVPTPSVPGENCITAAKVELGRHLFYDKRLSGNESMSCASCHQQQFAFSDRKVTPNGIAPPNDLLARNSQQLVNVAYNTKLTWINPNLASLEIQSRVPLFAETPVELGLTGTGYLDKLANQSYYRSLFSAAFGSETINEQNVRYALASFQRTMLSFNSPYDKFTRGQGSLSSDAIAGADLFFGETAECFHCHGGFNFTDTTLHSQSVFTEFAYHDNGIHSTTYYNGLSSDKRGLYDITHLATDVGKVKAPTLRNVGLSYPYMHDGSFTCTVANPVTQPDACAREALDNIILNNYMAGGATPSNKDTALIRPFSITGTQRQQLVEFLMSLTDSEFIGNSNLANPRSSDPNFGP